jgi:YD repeat-containing protein
MWTLRSIAVTVIAIRPVWAHCIEGRGIVTNYVYNDPENLLTDVQYPATTNLNVKLTYDSYGRAATMSDGSSGYSSTSGHVYTYDDMDNQTSAQTNYQGATAGTLLPTQTLNYALNPDRSQKTMGTPAGTFTYGYDGDGRMLTLTNPFSETTTWGYQDNGWLASQHLANGVVTSYVNNALGAMSSLTNKTSSGTILSQFSGMIHDGAGNINAVDVSIPSAPATYSGHTSYSYDVKDQLAQESSTRAGSYTNNFVYDYGVSIGPGNPTTFRSISGLTYNADNQLTKSGFSYDGNGNPTTYNGNSLTFDPEDRMTSYGFNLRAGYTEGGLRSWKQPAVGAIAYYLYDNSLPVCELDASGNITAVNTFGRNGLVSRRAGSISTYYVFDTQGGWYRNLTVSQPWSTRRNLMHLAIVPLHPLPQTLLTVMARSGDIILTAKRVYSCLGTGILIQIPDGLSIEIPLDSQEE